MFGLNNLLEINNCDTTEFMELTHRTMLLFILEDICKKMKTDTTTREYILSQYYQSNDDIQVAGEIARKFCGTNLPQEDMIWLNECIMANLKKRGKRKTVSFRLKKELLARQNNKCACCKRPITLDNSHCDHIIPWDYVGDELKNNYQMLCTYCNEHKSTITYYMLKRQIIKSNL